MKAKKGWCGMMHLHTYKGVLNGVILPYKSATSAAATTTQH
jgi:hypothetical protein